MSSRVPPGQVVTHSFPVLHAGSVPNELTPQNWNLSVTGRIRNPRDFSFADLLSLPQKEEVVDIHCVTSWTKLGTRWAGATFEGLEQVVRPEDSANFVIMECEQGFTTSLPRSVLEAPEVLLAHSYDGQPLPKEHGGPVRMLVPQRYFYKSAKWLRGLKFVERDEPGFWEVRGYSNVADPWLQTRYDVDDKRVIQRMRKESLFRPLGGAEKSADSTI